jgi:2'-5' RNA ligase
VLRGCGALRTRARMAREENGRVFAVEVYLDADADERVRNIWSALDERGIQSLGGIQNSDYHPHVTLAVYEGVDSSLVADAVAPLLADCRGMPLALASVGFFLADESVAFLGVVPTERLLALHHAVHEVLQGLRVDVWPHYKPGSIVPHCTLAMGEADVSTIVAAVGQVALPIDARAEAAHVVEIATGRSRRRIV